MRQLVDEAHRVGQHDPLARGQRDLRGVVGSSVANSMSAAKHVGVGQRVEQRATCRRWCSRPAPPSGVRRARAAAPRWLALALAPPPARLADPRIASRMSRRSVSSWLSPGPRGADAAAPVRERWVHSRVRRGRWYSSCGQLDLQAALARAGVAREDVEDQRRAVQHLAVEQLLEVALLVRRQLVVDDQQVEAAGCLLVDQLGRAALAEVPDRVRPLPALECAAHDRGTGGLRQGAQLRQAALHRPAPVRWVVEADEEGALGGRGEVDQAAAVGHLCVHPSRSPRPNRPRGARCRCNRYFPPS